MIKETSPRHEVAACHQPANSTYEYRPERAVYHHPKDSALGTTGSAQTTALKGQHKKSL